ncbi:hypothetical protein [Herbaspirillum sp. YR522]|uniref:hypothetical protein n=1 Tax=Herbaspirillum sp. YR522 TaxID=1144342 RepID=UPI00026F5CBC|nr:hypothetical protein [Herbaspirillum sp. YR522]EJN01745.1 hypothetical protein PMI40_03232 [Herbaspirillum sp. YR522]
MPTRKIAADDPSPDPPQVETARIAAQARMEKIWQRQELAGTWPSGQASQASPAPAADPRMSPPGQADIDQQEHREKVYDDGDIFRGRPGRATHIP